MTGYVLRRLLGLIPVLLFVSFVTFGLVRLAPGDPVLIVLGGKKVDPATAAALREQFGLVGDPITQYVAWLGRALQGDLGESYRLRQYVVGLIADRREAEFEQAFGNLGFLYCSNSRRVQCGDDFLRRAVAYGVHCPAGAPGGAGT